jgi:hypothetical protein
MKYKDRFPMTILAITFFAMLATMNLSMRDAKYASAWDLTTLGLGMFAIFLTAIILNRETRR